MSLVRIYREMRDDPRPQNFHGRGRPRWDERLAAKKEEEERRSPVIDGVVGECSIAVADEEGQHLPVDEIDPPRELALTPAPLCPRMCGRAPLQPAVVRASLQPAATRARASPRSAPICRHTSSPAEEALSG